MYKPLKIIIVDHHNSFREAFRFYIERKLQYSVIFESENAEKILKSELIYEADIIFLDIELPDINGIELAKKLLNISPKIRLIAISMYDDMLYLRQVISAGFRGAMFKSNFYTILEKGMNEVMQNRLFFPENMKL
jgi:DNA-binding NarL/FixJ family response regulator